MKIQHSAHVSPEEVIGSMALGHGDGIGGSGKGRISSKTMCIALNCQKQMDRMNTEAADELAQRLLELIEALEAYLKAGLEKPVKTSPRK